MKAQIALAALLLSAPAAQASDASHHGSAKTPTTFDEWSTTGFTFQHTAAAKLGGTEKINCPATAGCVLHVVLEANILASETGSFFLGMSADHEQLNPAFEIGATCHKNDGCTITMPGTVVVAMGPHIVELGYASNITGGMLAWSGHTEMVPMTK